MKHLILVLSFLISSQVTFACFAASQNRLFPIGYKSKGIFFLETRFIRTNTLNMDTEEEEDEEGVEQEIAWYGVCYIKQYNKSYKEVYSELLDSVPLFNAALYDTILQELYSKAYLLANQNNKLESFHVPTFSFCNYSKLCKEATFKYDTNSVTPSIILGNKKVYKMYVLADTASLAGNMVKKVVDYSGYPLENNAYADQLYVNSIRKFKMGAKILTIIHVEIGEVYEEEDFSTSEEVKRENSKINTSLLKYGLFNEAVLFHGVGFDYFVIE